MVHLVEGVHNHIDGSRDCRVALDFVLRYIPIFSDVGQVFVTGDDENVEVGLVSVLWLIDPVSPTVAAKKNNRLDLAVLLPGLRRPRNRDAEFVQQDLRHARQLFLLDHGEMIDVFSHAAILARSA